MSAPARARRFWRYTFCDLATRRPLARLPVLAADLQEVIGGPGDGKGRVPLDDDDVRAADPWAATAQRRTIVFAQRIVTVDGRESAWPALWAGIVWKRNLAGTSIALNMTTPESYLARRRVAQPRTFVDEDDAVIMRTLLADALAVPGGSMGGVDLGAGLAGSTSSLDVTTDTDESLLDRLTAVADTAGVEWRLRPGWDERTRRFSLTLLVGAPRLGSRRTDALVWTSDPGNRQANEVLGYEVVEDGSDVPTELLGIATPDDAPQLRSVQTSGEVEQGWPLLQGSAKSETDGITTQARLDRLVAAELGALHATERTLTGLTVRGDRGPDLTDYGLGDALTVRARDRLWPAPTDVTGRVLGRRIAPGDAGGTETVAMSLGVA